MKKIEINKKSSKNKIPEIKEKKKVGAKCMLSEKKHLLIEGFRRGYTDLGSCAHADICQKTFYLWRNKGLDAEKEGREDEFLQFLQEIRKATEESCNYALDCWKSKFEEDWKAAKEYLERKDSKNWNLKQKVEISVDDGELLAYLPLKKVCP